MFTELLSASSITRACDEDLCSQVNYMWTAVVISVVGLLITMVQYVGDPIHCLCPAQLTEAQCNYTKALCWVKQNYFVHEDNPIALKEDDRYELTVAYYPWVPWILFFMAAMLNVPNIIWQACAPASGLNLKKFIDKADMHEGLDNLGRVLMLWLGERRREDLSVVGKVQRAVGSWGCFWYGRYQRSYLCGLVLMTKLGYLTVSLGMFFSLNIFVDENMLMYGFDVIRDFLHGASYELARFPVYTLCDIKIRQLNNIQTYSFQCVLPLNMYNQKIFLCLWFWLFYLSILNAYSFAKWALHLLSYANRRRFVKNYVIILHHLLQKKNSGRRRDRNANAIDADGGTEGEEPAARDGGGNDDLEITPLSGAGVDVNESRRSSSSASLSASGPRPRRVRISLPNFVHSLRSRSRSRPTTGGDRLPASRPISSIEADDEEIETERARRRGINRITTKMMKEFGHDGVVVFRILENAVGVVISNRIFQELYEQLEDSMHCS